MERIFPPRGSEPEQSEPKANVLAQGVVADDVKQFFIYRDPLYGLGTCDHVDERGWPLLTRTANATPASY